MKTPNPLQNTDAISELVDRAAIFEDEFADLILTLMAIQLLNDGGMMTGPLQKHIASKLSSSVRFGIKELAAIEFWKLIRKGNNRKTALSIVAENYSRKESTIDTYKRDFEEEANTLLDLFEEDFLKQHAIQSDEMYW